jgi:hypothetical protein
MPRKITSGRVGAQVLGSLVTADNSFQSVEANANIILEPNGTGIVESTSDVLIGGNKSLRLEDGDTNYVAIKAPAALSANYTLVLPADDGASGQTLRSDGSGNLSWNTPTLSVANRTAADGATYYLAMVDAASLPGSGQSTAGVEDTLSVADGSRLEFIPNPGKLTVNQIAILGSTTSSTTGTGALTVAGGVGVGGQVTATTIVETSSIALKENINPIANALDLITGLKGVTYDRLDNNEHEAGLIAEWTNDVLPDMVAKDSKGNITGIKYSKLTAYLIEAVKSLKSEVEDLKRKI